MAQVTSGRVSGAFSQCLGWPAMDKISASAVLSHLTPDLGYIARQSPTSWQQHFYPARFGRVTRGGGGRDRQRPPNHESQANVSALSPVHVCADVFGVLLLVPVLLCRRQTNQPWSYRSSARSLIGLPRFVTCHCSLYVIRTKMCCMYDSTCRAEPDAGCNAEKGGFDLRKRRVLAAQA